MAKLGQLLGAWLRMFFVSASGYGCAWFAHGTSFKNWLVRSSTGALANIKRVSKGVPLRRPLGGGERGAVAITTSRRRRRREGAG